MTNNRNSSQKTVRVKNHKVGLRRPVDKKDGHRPAAAKRNGRKPRADKAVRHAAALKSGERRAIKSGRPISITTQREKLEAERQEVTAELARLRAELQEAPEATGDEVDLSVYDRERTLGLIEAYQRRLEEIERAQRAAQKGAYGICERCGQPIDPARLKIFPETRFCVRCKNEEEQLARRRMA